MGDDALLKGPGDKLGTKRDKTMFVVTGSVPSRRCRGSEGSRGECWLRGRLVVARGRGRT
jgi:hypothetical protein